MRLSLCMSYNICCSFRAYVIKSLSPSSGGVRNEALTSIKSTLYPLLASRLGYAIYFQLKMREAPRISGKMNLSSFKAPRWLPVTHCGAWGRNREALRRLHRIEKRKASHLNLIFQKHEAAALKKGKLLSMASA